MSACLKENLTSHAFDGILSYRVIGLYMASSVRIGYEVIWEELYDSVQCVYTLTDPAVDQVWNQYNYTRVPYYHCFISSYSVQMYLGVQVEQCLLLRILYYNLSWLELGKSQCIAFLYTHIVNTYRLKCSLTLLISVMVGMITRIGVHTRYAHACPCVV